MRQIAVFLFLAAASASASQRDPAAAITASSPQMEALMARTKAPGAAVAVTIGDRIVWQETFGVTSVDSKSSVAMHTRFRVGSLTKLMTVAAMMRLVDEKRLALDDPVSKYLPDFPHGSMTLRQLAGHLGGIRHYGPGEFISTTHYANATAALVKFAKDPLVAAPGEKYLYSTYGYDVLGAVIENVTGKAFDAAMESLVFQPLKMTETSFDSDARTAAFYDLSDSGPVVAPTVDLSDRLPAGAAVTTAHDLARLLIATPALPAEVFTSQKTADGKPTGVGIGWRVAADEKGRAYVHHGGAVTGGRGVVVLYLKERVGVVILTNLGFAQFNEQDAVAIAANFLE
jgi:CubicO group peptidase (beta-lactamase class C family)